MEFLQQLIDFILHIDKHLLEIINNYGTLTYLILFVIIFSETGFVVTPFLPGDSLLFAIGALSASGALNVWFIIVLLIIAAFAGNMINFFIGRYIGPKIFAYDNIRFIKREYLIKTQEFYAKHGVKAVIIGRFLPIFRTFVPFVAGVGNMNLQKFTFYNLLSAIIWVAPFTLAGYWFGNIPFVKNNFTLVVLGIIFITVLPALITGIRMRMQKQHS